MPHHWSYESQITLISHNLPVQWLTRAYWQVNSLGWLWYAWVWWKTLIYWHYITHDHQHEVQVAVGTLEENLFINAGKLQSKISIATKDPRGWIGWVTFDPAYHSKLVKTAIAVAKATSPNLSVTSIKEARFTFIINILNRKPQQDFFTQDTEWKGAIKHKHAMSTAWAWKQAPNREHNARMLQPSMNPPTLLPMHDRPPAECNATARCSGTMCTMGFRTGKRKPGLGT